MNISKFYLPVSALIFSISLFGCNNKNQEKPMVNTQDKIEVKIGESGSDFKNKYPNIVRIKDQPVGVTFYKVDWEENKKGIVHFQNGNHSFEIDNVLGFSGSEDHELRNEGMSQLNVISGLSEKNGISHQHAREKVAKILSGLTSHGWQSVIPYSAPRLRGKDMLNYLIETQRPTTLDAIYEPSIDEWMKLRDMTTWELYADGVFLQLNFVRDSTKLDVSKPGAYVLNMTLKSDTNYFKGFVPALQRAQWRELLPNELSKAGTRRSILETELRSKGLKIDEAYRDPPVPK